MTDIPKPFDLPRFMFSRFGRVDFGGDLFSQWPVGLRFEIGLQPVWRATAIHDFVYKRAADCIVVSQDWPADAADPYGERCAPLFSRADVFSGSTPSEFQTVDMFPFDETPYRLSWTRLALPSLNADRMFQAIASRETGGSPAIGSGVYTIDDRAELIMHMYDDRGLDVIAVNAATLLPVYEQFGDWILDHQRHRIGFRFEQFLKNRSTDGETD